MNAQTDSGAPFIGAIDIGGTKMAASIAAATGLIARVEQPTIKTGSPDAVPLQAIAMLEEACAQAGVDGAHLQAVGVCSAGPFVRIDGALALVTPNICGGLARDRDDSPNDWTSVPLEAVLRRRFSTLVIENDGVAALLAERCFGAAQGESDCAYVTWSTGIGFGLCVDGRILRGKHGNAGHAGHMLMSESDDAECGCGNRGDLEALISGRNLGARHGKPLEQLFSAARNGDPESLAILTQAAIRFGRALYNITVVLDTRLFVIGGSVWEHQGDWLAPIVRQELASHLPALTAGVRVEPAALGSLVADIGACCLVMPEQWVAAWRRSGAWRHSP